MTCKAKDQMNIQPPFGTAANNRRFSGQSIVEGAIKRTRKALFEQNIVPWKLVPRNELPRFEPSIAKPKIFIKSLEIEQTGSDDAKTFKSLAGDVDESYSLSLDENGTAKISATSSIGILHALETFNQLFYKHSSGDCYTKLAPGMAP